MVNLQQLVIDHFVRELSSSYTKAYGQAEPHFATIIEWSGYLALENISNCDALYHNMEHTIMVTLVGQEIIRGKHLCEGGVTPRDWLHFILALLFHDIGYVRGICNNDGNGFYATGKGDEIVEVTNGGSDASMTPYHVDRGKLFIQERFGGKLLIDADADMVASLIERTRFPVPEGGDYHETADFPGLLRAADFVGQLGDPNYLRKIPALFYEFEELGSNEKMGYKSPEDMRKSYAKFYWNVVNDYIQPALRFLRITQEGKQWISNLHSHVFTVEHSNN